MRWEGMKIITELNIFARQGGRKRRKRRNKKQKQKEVENKRGERRKKRC